MVNSILSSLMKQDSYLVEITRELDKEFPMYSYTIYAIITSPILSYIYCL